MQYPLISEYVAARAKRLIMTSRFALVVFLNILALRRCSGASRSMNINNFRAKRVFMIINGSLMKINV